MEDDEELIENEGGEQEDRMDDGRTTESPQGGDEGGTVDDESGAGARDDGSNDEGGDSGSADDGLPLGGWTEPGRLRVRKTNDRGAR